MYTTQESPSLSNTALFLTNSSDFISVFTTSAYWIPLLIFLNKFHTFLLKISFYTHLKLGFGLPVVVFPYVFQLEYFYTSELISATLWKMWNIFASPKIPLQFPSFCGGRPENRTPRRSVSHFISLSTSLMLLQKAIWWRAAGYSFFITSSILFSIFSLLTDSK